MSSHKSSLEKAKTPLNRSTVKTRSQGGASCKPLLARWYQWQYSLPSAQRSVFNLPSKGLL
eukprot:788357-Amphidinium_carterae.1